MVYDPFHPPSSWGPVSLFFLIFQICLLLRALSLFLLNPKNPFLFSFPPPRSGCNIPLKHFCLKALIEQSSSPPPPSTFLLQFSFNLKTCLSPARLFAREVSVRSTRTTVDLYFSFLLWTFSFSFSFSFPLATNGVPVAFWFMEIGLGLSGLRNIHLSSCSKYLGSILL